MVLKNRYIKDCNEFGIDEVGRGCLFGPVCVCAVYITEDIDIPDNIKLRDSKKTTPKQREKIMDFVNDNPNIYYEYVFIDNNVIDDINILQATYKGMHKSIQKLSKKIKPDHLVIDGDKFKIYMDDEMDVIPHKCIPKGDDLYTHISLAANIAKVKRDTYIINMCKNNPWLDEYYGLSGNKGYGTSKHMEGIRKFGITKYHRLSFKPCNQYDMCENEILFIH